MTDLRRLASWQQRCQTAGLTVTAPRRAILIALLEPMPAQDAVQLLQTARAHYPATSLGTVYRFLRELEHHQLAQPLAQPHGRLLWRLDTAAAQAGQPADADLLGLLRQLAQRLGYRLEPA